MTRLKDFIQFYCLGDFFNAFSLTYAIIRVVNCLLALKKKNLKNIFY